MHLKRLGVLCFLMVSCTADNALKGGPPDNTSCSEPASVVVGSGELEWVNLDPGDGVDIVYGSQGGWHIVGSADVTGMDSGVTIHFTITDVKSGILVSDNSYESGFTTEEECSGSLLGMYGYLDVETLTGNPEVTPPEALAYHTIEMRMEAEDSAGRRAESRIEVVAIPEMPDEN